jgi:glycosyltransferase involved in cell wall biosynthesis
VRIAYIATAQIPSTRANSIQVMKVCQALKLNGESVELYVPGKEQAGWDDLSKHYGIEERFPITWLRSQPVLKRLDFTTNGLRLARLSQTDVVYTRMLWVAWAARFFGLPVILEMHDLPTGRIGPLLYRNFLRSNSRKLTIYITRALKELTDQACRIQARSNEWMIAPDGVDLERYEDLPDAEQARKMLNLPERITAAYSGGFYQGRGLEALQHLAQAFPDVQFLWIGGNAQQVAALKQKIDLQGIDNVILTGFIPNEELPLYQAAAEILLMPYAKRFSGSGGGNIASVSSPMKMFEYMAAGRAILTSSIPVLREVLNESNAVFYIPEDFDDLRQQFSTLINDNALRDRLAQQARMDVRAYEWKTRMKRIMQVFANQSN